ncbi:MAG TPA: cytochrome C oxidase subunit IV family protein [Mucilaginibacter sp.]|nr:cytochrome C oxidase subunit IV family protein [Mucilaginibacter sp.]
MSSEHSDTVSAHAEEHEGMNKKRIWNVFYVLVVVTSIEFLIALYLVPHGILKVNVANPLYIVLTLVKAFFIVGYFMHLKFERPGLIFAIVIPVLFLIGLILVLTNESHHWIFLRS